MIYYAILKGYISYMCSVHLLRNWLAVFHRPVLTFANNELDALDVTPAS